LSNFAAQNCDILLETLISSKTRVKLLLKFFLNSSTTAYLRGLEAEFGESSNAIRLELNRFEDAGMIISHADGNKKVFTANTEHPLFREIHNILLKYIGFDKIIETVIERLGEVRIVFVTGDFAQGRDSRVIDLVFIGDDIDRNYLIQLIEKAEKLIQRKIRFLIYASDEFNSEQWRTQHASALLLWSSLK
jgi:hypothetical protein